MISVATARALAGTGLAWEPARGDRFIIPDRGMDEEVFVLSDMTIEAQERATGKVLGFNGTTEWALDSVAAADVLWLPGEGSLRALLGPALIRLEPVGLAGWSVSVGGPAGSTVVVDPDAEEAYALALLTVRAVRLVDLLPLAAHAVSTRTLEIETAGAWQADAGERLRTQVVEDLVDVLRRVRAVATGADQDEAGGQVRLVADADPVAEDRPGTVGRALAAVLRDVTDEGQGADVLIALVLAASALGASVPVVCASAALAAARGGAGRAGDAEEIGAIARP